MRSWPSHAGKLLTAASWPFALRRTRANMQLNEVRIHYTGFLTMFGCGQRCRRTCAISLSRGAKMVVYEKAHVDERWQHL